MDTPERTREQLMVDLEDLTHSYKRLQALYEQDITQRLQAEEQLLFIRKAIESSSDAIGISDAQGHHFYQNRALSELFEYATAEELEAAGGGPKVVKDTTVAKEMFDQILNSKSWSGELEMITKSGRIFPAYERADAIMDVNGKLIGLIGIITDITERKANEQALEKLNMAITNSHDVIFMTDIQGIITFINPEFTKMYGYEAAEVIGKVTPRILNSGQSTRDTVEYFWNALLNKQKLSAEYVNKCKDGSMIDIEGSAGPILDHHGDIIGFLGIQRDITGRKRAEAELVRAKNHAEESDRLKSAFLANMSHEIRTPLNSIIGFSEILNEEDNDPDDIAKYSGIIKASGNRLLELISNIIDISKIESGTEILRTHSVNPSKTIEEVISQFQLTSNGKSIEVKKQVPPNLEDLEIRTDSLKLHQILSNLLNNALKFSEEGVIEIGIEKSANAILFWVKDNGIGISKDQLERIFDRFYQVDSNYSRRYEGAGLGLSLCRGIVKLLGGKIWAESEPGKGSTFYFTIPINPE